MSGIVEKRVIETRKGFNHKRWKELYDNPPNKMYNEINKEWFFVDQDIFRKECQYIYDMVFKVLDVFGLFGGMEGSGKSTDASQIGQQFWYILNECNILRKDLGTYYDYTDDNCLTHNLESFLEKCDKYNDELWRIIICDEAGDLKSEDRWEEANKIFRDDMRKDRKKLRIRLMCYPVPFELVKDFTLGRTNFIRMNRFSKDKNGFGSIPDIVDMIIIPRGDFTYSFNTKEQVKREEIKHALLELSKSRYTSDLQKKYIYKTTRKDNVFCFDAEKYIKQAKEENRMKKKQEKIYISDNLIRIIAEKLTAGKIGLSIKVPQDLPKEEREEKEREKRDALLVSKLVNACRDKVKKNKLKNFDKIELLENENENTDLLTPQI